MNQAWIRFALIVSMFTAPFAWAQRPPDIPSGTPIRIRMIDSLNSEDAAAGDTFHATLEEPITVNGRDLFPRGADVVGRITDVHKSGRLSEPGELDLVLKSVSSGNVTSYLRVQPLVIKGESHTKSNAGKIGGGAALGAVIGAIAGGGKGAAIGTVAGGAAGTGAAAATGKRPATIESEALLDFTTTSVSNTVNGPPDANAPQNAPDPDRPILEHRNDAPPADSASPPPANDVAAAQPSAAPSGPLFTLRDRRIIRSCVNQHAADFPADALKKPELPAGSERDIHPGGKLPADAQNAAKSLPLDCVRQLPDLPSDLDRVVYKGRVLLIDSRDQIADEFWLQSEQ